jgi:hypothetical protein
LQAARTQAVPRAVGTIEDRLLGGCTVGNICARRLLDRRRDTTTLTVVRSTALGRVGQELATWKAAKFGKVELEVVLTVRRCGIGPGLAVDGR